MSYTVAVASSDGVHVDAHFGQAKRFAIIEVDEAEGAWRVRGWRDVPAVQPAPLAAASPSCQARFDEVARVLSDVDYVWATQIGPKAHRVLKAHGLEPLEVPERIDEAIAGVNRYRARVRR